MKETIEINNCKIEDIKAVAYAFYPYPWVHWIHVSADIDAVPIFPEESDES